MNENKWADRWSNAQIRAILLEQFDSFRARDTGIQRGRLADIEKAAASPHAVIISGLRRVGKSTLLAQWARRLGEDAFYYLNFEDDRFIGFQARDIDDLYKGLVELFGDRKIFILDEIQNVPGWEHFVRRFMDMGFKFYISGSNASLLGQELGSRLTGRYIPIELFPFDFTEYLRFKEQEMPDFQRMTTLDQARMNRLLTGYLLAGGIPEALKYPELPISKTLYDDVIYRDIAARYRLEAVPALKELAFFLISNPGCSVSFNKLKQRLQLGSVNTISSFIEYFENSWLFFSLNRYAFSLKSRQVAPKKIYCIDTGLANSVGFHFSPDSGKLLENLVFLMLRQKTREVYYLHSSGGYEIDFYLPGQRQVIKVCQRFEKQATRERELRAIEDAARDVNIAQAVILTETNEADMAVGKTPVKIRSVTEWLSEQA